MASTQNQQPAMEPQVVSTAPTRPPRTGLSKWWSISLFIAAVIFFIIGGGLIGAMSSSYYYSGYGYRSTFYGAIACFVIGGLCKMVAWVLLIVYFVQRRRPQQPTVSYVNYPLTTSYTAPPPAGISPPAPVQSPTPSYPNPYQQGMGVKFCGQCGAAVSSPFCTQCGSKET